MKKTFFLFLFIFSLVYSGQAQDSFVPKNGFLNNQVKLAPFRLFDLVHPAFALSYERTYAQKKISTQFTAGYLVSAYKEAFVENLKGYMLGLEQKYFFHPERDINTYLSVDAGYYQSKFGAVSSFGEKFPQLDTTGTSNNYLDTFNVRKKVTTISLKYGFQMQYKCLVFDLGFGLGVRIRNVQHNNRLVPGDEMESPRHPNPWYFSWMEGSFVTVNVPVTFRIGFVF